MMEYRDFDYELEKFEVIKGVIIIHKSTTDG